MRTFEITIQRAASDGWPVVAEYGRGDAFLSQRAEGRLQLDPSALTADGLDHRAFGLRLGQALFRDGVRDLLSQATADGDDPLRMLLAVEAPDLRATHWERLCAPRGGGWDFLALDHSRPFSLYLPSVADRRFPPIGRRDLRALLLAASPTGLGDYDLASFDTAEACADLRAALGPLPCDTLAEVAGAVGPPTLDALCERLTAAPFTLLHVVCHGRLLGEPREPVLYLTGQDGQVDPVTATRLLDRLGRLRGARGLPRLVFLASCASADPSAEAGLGGLGQRLVRDLGTPAVVAMTAPVSTSTAAALATSFYGRLREHGEVDRALAEATAGLAGRDDALVPALFSRLGGRPLFSDTIDRPLTATEIRHGLERLTEVTAERAPVLVREVERQGATLDALLDERPAELGRAAAEERDASLKALDQLCDRVAEVRFAGLALGAEPPPYDGRCPFRGLDPFRAEDRAFFFGREALVEDMRRRLVDEPLLAILGPSGSGKSSVALAGLTPALAAMGYATLVLTPGSDPVAILDSRLAERGDWPAALVVDQFEEVFTLCRNEEQRRAFIDRLVTFATSDRVVLTLRLDFLGECARFPAFWAMLQTHQQVVAPLTPAELRTVVERQAATVNLRFEADLAQTILDDVAGEPGAMPLLQHALLELWRRRHGRWLMAEEYRALGGVQEAIAHTADALYDDLGPEEREQTRDIFVRLTRLDDDVTGDDDTERVRRDTRRRVALVEVTPADGDEAATRRLVARLASGGLLVTGRNAVTGQDEVTMAHEALLRYWPRLRDWLDEDRAGLRAREQVCEAAQDWAIGGRDESLLVHRGQRLRAADALAQQPRTALNMLEREYVDACVALREREAAGLRRRSVILLAVTLTAVVFAVAALFSWWSAEEQRRVARARGLAASAVAETSTDPERAVLLARLAVDDTAVDAGDQALRRALISLPVARLGDERQTRVTSAVFSPDGRSLVTVSQVDGPPAAWRLRLWDAETGALLRDETLGNRAPTLAVGPGRERLLTVGGDGLARLWETERLERAADDQPVPPVGQVLGAALRPDGRWTLAGMTDRDRRLLVLDGPIDGQWRELNCGDRLTEPVTSALFSHDAGLLLAAGRATAWLWETGTWTCRGAFPLVPPGEAGQGAPQARGEIMGAYFSRDGGRLVLVGGVTASGPTRRGDAVLYETAHPERGVALKGHVGPVTNVAISLDDRWIVTTGWDTTARVWDLASGRLVATLGGHASRVTGAAFSRFDRQGEPLVLTYGEDRTVRVWEAATGRPRAVLSGHAGAIASAAFEPGGRRVATTSDDGTARVWLIDPLPVVATIRHDGGARSVAFSSDGRWVATAGRDGVARLREVTSGREVVLRAPPGPPGGVEGCQAEEDGPGDGLTGAFLLKPPDQERQLVATFGDHSCVARLWDVEGGQPLAVLRHAARTTDLAIDPTGRRLVTTSADGNARIWRAIDGSLEHTLPKQPPDCPVEASAPAYPRSAAFSPDGARLVTVQTDCAAAVWDVATGALIARLVGHEGRVRTAAFSPDGRLVVTAGGDKTPRVWEVGVASAILKRELRGVHTQSVESVAFSPDGRWLATAASRPDNRAVLWDTDEWHPRALAGHADRVETVAFSRDSRWVITASEDTTARVWDTRGGLAFLELSGPTERLWSATFSPDGQYLATASEDGLAFVYRCGEICGPLDELRALARRRVTRELACEEIQRYLGETRPCPTPTLSRQ